MTASRQGLVQVPVVDRNGRLTTRWKRVDSTDNSASSIPAPQGIRRKPRRMSMMKELNYNSGNVATMLHDHVEVSGLTKDEQEEMLKDLHPDTLHVLEEELVGSNGANESIVPIRECIEDRSIASLNNAATLINALDRGRGDYEIYKYLMAVSGLQWHSPGLEKVDYSKMDENAQEGGRALITAANGLHRPYTMNYSNGNKNMVYIPSKKLAGLILRRPQDVDRIVNVLKERRLPVSSDEDIKDIESLLDNDGAISLDSGIL